MHAGSGWLAPLNPSDLRSGVRLASPKDVSRRAVPEVLGGGRRGGLKGKHFVVGGKAKDGNDHVIYDDGKLSYDADGRGGEKAVVFATLKGAPDIGAGDFLVL